jgi:hypothetical protein
VHPQPGAFLALQPGGGLADGPLDRVGQRCSHCHVQRLHVGIADAVGLLERRQPGDVQDLVGVGVADSGDEPLVGQGALELTTMTAQDLGQFRGAELHRVRPEPSDAGHGGGVANDVHRQALLGALLGEVEAGTVIQMDPQRKRTAARLRRRWRQLVPPVQPAGPGQVYDEVQPADVEVQELPVPPCPGDLQPGQRGVRRVERLDRRHRAQVDAGENMPDRALAQER